jgi:release factor glutamine methyltransferase
VVAGTELRESGDATAATLLARSGLPRREARALLAHVLGIRRERLIAHPQMPVARNDEQRFADYAARRRAGEPLAYLLGSCEFYGRSFTVTPSVLVPRPETELLIDLALEELADRPAPRILDLGTGSGCIAITLALERPDASIEAVDACGDALAVASRNALALGARVAFRPSDWFSAVTGRFDLIVANPPYIAAGDPHLASLTHEPLRALTDHADGLDCLRAIIGAAADYPGSPAASLMLEHGHDQAAQLSAHCARRAGLVEVIDRRMTPPASVASAGPGQRHRTLTRPDSRTCSAHGAPQTSSRAR